MKPATKPASAPSLTEEERAILAKFRSLDAADKEAVLRAGLAMVNQSGPATEATPHRVLVTVNEVQDATEQLLGALEGMRLAVALGASDAEEVDIMLASGSTLLQLSGDLGDAKQGSDSDTLTVSIKAGHKTSFRSRREAMGP